MGTTDDNFHSWGVLSLWIEILKRCMRERGIDGLSSTFKHFGRLGPEALLVSNINKKCKTSSSVQKKFFWRFYWGIYSKISYVGFSDAGRNIVKIAVKNIDHAIEIYHLECMLEMSVTLCPYHFSVYLIIWDLYAVKCCYLLDFSCHSALSVKKMNKFCMVHYWGIHNWMLCRFWTVSHLESVSTSGKCSPIERDQPVCYITEMTDRCVQKFLRFPH